jgi:hypothetical protein
MPLLFLMWATAWLLLVSSFHHNHVSAAVTLEQIKAVETTSLKWKKK